MNNITIIHGISILFSIISLFISLYFFNCTWFIGFLISPDDMTGVIDRLFSSECDLMWIIVVLTIALPMILETGWRAFRRELRPSFNRILRERLRKTDNANDVAGSLSLVDKEEYERQWISRKAKTTKYFFLFLFYSSPFLTSSPLCSFLLSHFCCIFSSESTSIEWPRML